MRKVKINPGDVVRIDWYDHYSWTPGWKKLDKVINKDLEMAIVSTTGLLVAEAKHYYLVAMNWHGPINEAGHWTVADFMMILKGVVCKTQVLKKKEVEFE